MIADTTTIRGNSNGTDLTGTQRRANVGSDIFIENGSFNVIGGTTAADRNVISSNGVQDVVLPVSGRHGISLSGTPTSAAQANLIVGNFIGTDVGNPNNLGNFGFGVRVSADGNTIGGPLGAGNVIAFTRPDPLGRVPGVAVAPGRVGIRFSVAFARAPQPRYTDRNDDVVNLRLASGDVLELVRGADGEGQHLRWLGTARGRRVLSGPVRRRRRAGDGRTTLQTITGIDQFGTIRLRLQTPLFFIGLIIPAGVDALLAWGQALVDRQPSSSRRP